MLIISALCTFAFMPAASLYPLMTLGYFHGSIMQAGIVEVVWSAGSLIGGMIIGIYGTWKDRMVPIMLGMAVMGVAFALCGVLVPTMTGFIIFVALNVVAGMACAFPTTLPMAMVQQSFPPHELGRVFGVFMSLTSISGPIGLLFVGPLADTIGVQWVFAVSGVGCLLCAGLMLIVPSARLYDRRLQRRLKLDEVNVEQVEVS